MKRNIQQEYNHAKLKESIVKTILYVIGVLLIIGGGIWALQGVNILPGSFMSGQIQWAINGMISIVVGMGLILWARRK